MLHPFSRRRFLAATTLLGGLAWTRLGHAAGDETAATQRLNGWLEARYDFWLGRSPMAQAYLGLKTNADKWDDVSEAHQLEDHTRVQQELADLRGAFHPETLSPSGRISFDLYARRCEMLIDDHAWRRHRFPVNQLDGWQQEIPDFLMNIHRVESREDAEAYIARLSSVDVLVTQVIDQMRRGEAVGVLAPRFTYAAVLRDCRNVLTGLPFESNPRGDSPLWADIKAKIDALGVEPTVKDALRASALRALVTVLRPAYISLMAVCAEQEARAGADDGVWRLPDGEAYYAHTLRRHTTLDMSPADVHSFGLAEVARLHGEMRAITKQLGFAGDLGAFFAFLRDDPQFHYPQTAEGKSAYIARTEEIVAAMTARLDEVFLRRPRAGLVVKPVEAFREQSATAAFYQGPGAFDDRPGTYYVNTYDMKVMSKIEMESLAYHEAVPGHHMQIALAQEMDELPRFRRFSSNTAYDEGWGLYCERLAKEMGFYQDPYSDFGRLASELWRACRLVVDTGIHMADKRWTRSQAIAYLTENTPNGAGDIANSVERYIVDPGQATAYTIGMAKILELRAGAEERLGAKFDLRTFHDTVLANGSMPLPVLQNVVETWVSENV